MLLDQKIKIKWSNSNKNYYVSKGYPFTKIRDEFEIDVKDLSRGSKLSVEFICDYCKGKNQTSEKSKQKSYCNYLNSRKLTNRDSCNHPECRGSKISESQAISGIKNENVLGIKHPELVGEWSSKNLKSPFDYSFGDATIVWWNCSICKSEYDMKINSRTGQGIKCPYCAGRRVNHTNSLAALEPEIASEWHPSKNNNLSSHDVTRGSTKKVWWQCEKNHEWQDTVNYRTYSGRKCPYCFGRKVGADRALSTTHPDLIKELHPTMNVGFDPSKVYKGSGAKVWWICSKGHKWKTSIADRVRSKTNCPYCSNKKVCEENCLSTVDPNLAEEWNYDKNRKLTPQDVTHKSKKNVWWKCKVCNHSWKSTILNRSYGNGCPQCKESKGEKKIREILEFFNIIYKNQYKFNDLRGKGSRPLKFDFAIFNKNKRLEFLLEYDGEFHFNKVYKDDNYQILKEHDERKNKYCKKKNISLLRIPYWEFNSIEKILNNKLKDCDLIR